MTKEQCESLKPKTKIKLRSRKGKSPRHRNEIAVVVSSDLIQWPSRKGRDIVLSGELMADFELV